MYVQRQKGEYIQNVLISSGHSHLVSEGKYVHKGDEKLRRSGEKAGLELIKAAVYSCSSFLSVMHIILLWKLFAPMYLPHLILLSCAPVAQPRG